MTNDTVKKLLSKRKWTGEEVGKILVMSVINDIKNQQNPDYKPVITQKQFQKMELSLKTEKDLLAYGVYKDIYSSIIDAFNRGQGYFQQFYNGYAQYLNAMITCKNSDKMLEQAEKYPLIMTQSQFEKHKQNTKQRLENQKESFTSLIFYVLENFLKNPQKTPKNIRGVIRLTKEETVKNRRILANYNKLKGRGYYVLPDGRRSDQMTIKQWGSAVKRILTKDIKLVIDGKKAKIDELYTHYKNEQMLKAYELYFTGIDGIKALYKEVYGKKMKEVSEKEQALMMEILEDVLYFNGAPNDERIINCQAPLYPDSNVIYSLLEQDAQKKIKWHYYTEKPAVTKHDLLMDCLEFYSGETAETQAQANVQVEEFKADYPDLFSALEEYIKQSVPALKNLKPEDYNNEVVSWGELAEIDFMDYKAMVEPEVYKIAEEFTKASTPEESSENYKKRARVTRKGIAILQNPLSTQVDANGDYIEDENAQIFHETLDTLYEDAKKREEIEAFQNTLFKPALKFIYASNALMGILGEVYGICEMQSVSFNTEALENQSKTFNNLLFMFYASVYGDDAEKSKKQGILKKLFTPINTDALKPTPKAIKTVTEKISKLGLTTQARSALKNFDGFILELMGEEK